MSTVVKLSGVRSQQAITDKYS